MNIEGPEPEIPPPNAPACLQDNFNVSKPGINIDPGLVIPDILPFVVPTYPRQIIIDMRKSMEVKDFKVIVEFGRDE